MTSSRNAILSRLRDANPTLNTAKVPHYQPWHSDHSDTLKERFIRLLTASHAQVISSEVKALAETIKAVIVNKDLKRIALGSAGKFYEDIQQATQGVDNLIFDCHFSQVKKALFTEVDAGITHCRAGIADTGTLVLWPDIAEPRTLSLVPPCHIALIQRSTIVSHFESLMVTQAWQHDMPTNIVLVSGPSKTADIQQTLAYGAHGPSELIVILIEDM